MNAVHVRYGDGPPASSVPLIPGVVEAEYDSLGALVGVRCLAVPRPTVAAIELDLSDLLPFPAVWIWPEPCDCPGKKKRRGKRSRK